MPPTSFGTYDVTEPAPALCQHRDVISKIQTRDTPHLTVNAVSSSEMVARPKPKGFGPDTDGIEASGVKRQARARLAPRQRAELKARLRIETLHYKDDATLAKAAAAEIAAVIREKHDQGGAVLGLATGSTPIAVYEELIRMHRDEGLDFSRVKTFNLDEYLGLPPEHTQSYHQFMDEVLFKHLTLEHRAIQRKNIHIPNGNLDVRDVPRECARFEAQIAAAGGIDLQILGIGRTGHIGFNEPGSSIHSKTRRVKLDKKTRDDAASAFGGIENVPTHAVTMGIKTILAAKRILLLATGEHKQGIVETTAKRLPTSSIPATHLKMHRNTTFLLRLE